MKLAPKTPRVRFRVSSSALFAWSGVKPDSCNKPRPPALETATASEGFAKPPIAAICIGTLQPTSSVNVVLSIKRQRDGAGIDELDLSQEKYGSQELLGREDDMFSA